VLVGVLTAQFWDPENSLLDIVCVLFVATLPKTDVMALCECTNIQEQVMPFIA